MSNKIKEILCLHHSHLDVGYTHPQNMLLELQADYIEQVIDLCIQTRDYPENSKFRWTCEATYPLLRWAKTADPRRMELFKEFLHNGQISIAALPFHTTPGCNLQQLVQSLQQLDEIRDLFDYNITTAINHDVNGQPWALSSLLLDSGIDFYLTGINIHFGGIPFPRPYVFRWMTPDGRPLTSYVGEHYSLFSQFCQTDKFDTALVHKGITDYVERISQTTAWDRDFLLLTSTNPPLLDNNSPDAQLADLIRKYNEEGHPQTIRMVTPEILRSYVQRGDHPLQAHAGDWTDYWNFGSASTPRELKFNRNAKTNLFASDFLQSLSGSPEPMRRKENRKQAYLNALLFDEHTWGAAESVVAPEQDETYAQQNHKQEFAYQAADLSAYLLSSNLEEFAGNPPQSDHQDGLILVNPTAVPLCQDIVVPTYMTAPGRTVSAARAKMQLPYRSASEKQSHFGACTVEPYSVRRIPFAALNAETQGEFTVTEEGILTPFYEVQLDAATGAIRQILCRDSGRELIHRDSPWDFFGMVEERIDPSQPQARSTIFPRDVDKGNQNISQWRHDWKALRTKAEFTSHSIKREADRLILTLRSAVGDKIQSIQRIIFSSAHPRIGLEVDIHKNADLLPNSIYLTFPLQLEGGWDCVYDTAGTFVHLDRQQLGQVCRDYITVDETVSLMDKAGGVTLACPDAPMVQIGDFHFGQENRTIDRTQNPLLLAWPMNNYWDTNFVANQSGQFSFRYELSPFSEFSPEAAYSAGAAASRCLAMGAAIDCGEEQTDCLIQVDSTHCLPVLIRPTQDGFGVLAAVRNFSAEPQRCCLRFFCKTITEAAVTDLLGNPLTPITPENGKIEFTAGANALIYLTLK